jgi:hypothetical protein
MMKIHVAYTREGRIVGGTIVQPNTRVRCRILRSPDFSVAEFDVPAKHATLTPADLWSRARIDVSTARHKLIVTDEGSLGDES